MIKQWSRYGSGCYNYQCEDGQLKIMVRNISYTCSHVDQKIPVELVDVDTRGENWLHTGSITCPKCSDLCQDCSREGDNDEVITSKFLKFLMQINKNYQSPEQF